MKCPVLSCGSSNVSSERKYKIGAPNRKKYAGVNLDRRRYTCQDCHRNFHTIEILEEDYERSYISPTTETGARIR